MSQEVKKLNIFQKLSSIQIELGAVAKNLEVGVGSFKYKAVGEADILHAVKPLENKYGVYSYPVSRKIIETGVMESTDKNGIVKKQLFERIEVVYRFVNVDNPSEYIDITSYGDGIDPQDKSVGKAMTYADKYALMKAYKILTGEDPDQYASEEQTKVETKKVNKPISPELIAECESYQINLQMIASFLKKTVEELTEADVAGVLTAKKKKVAKQNATSKTQKTTEPKSVEPQSENKPDENWID